MILDFVPLWTAILGLAVFFYVLLDGFDLASAFSTISPTARRRAIC